MSQDSEDDDATGSDTSTLEDSTAESGDAFPMSLTDVVPINANTATLHQAARNGDLPCVERLLKQCKVRKNINDLDENGISALHYAAKFTQLPVVEALLGVPDIDARVKDEDGSTPLHSACRKKCKNVIDDSEDDTSDPEKQAIRRIIQLLAALSDVNERDDYGCRPLHIASMKDNHTAVNTLLSIKAIRIDAKDEMGCTPLHYAATFNNLEVARLLIHSGANLDLIDNDRCTALHQAALEGFADIGELLIDSCEYDKSRFIDRRDREDCTALHYAVEAKCLPLVKLCVQNGADVGQRCRRSGLGSTPLHLAGSSADSEMAGYLIGCKADVNAKDRQGATPLHRAAEAKNAEVLHLLLANIATNLTVQDKEDYTSLLISVCYDDEDCVKSLLDDGSDIQATQHEEKNAFHLAVENEQHDILKILIEHAEGEEMLTALINADDSKGNTPLHMAAATGNLPITKELLEKKADISCKNEEEETPFLVAAKNGNLDAIREFTKYSNTVLNDEDEYSNTGLHLSAEKGHLQVVQHLCDNYSNKLAKNYRGQTPLDLACGKGHEPIVRYLLDEDVPANPLDNKTKRATPLHRACKYGHESVVTLLIGRGADVGITDDMGNNALVTAIEAGSTSAVEAILQSPAWYKALYFEQMYSHGKPRDTPLRKLITHMPGMANLALNRCVEVGPEFVSPYDPDMYINFDYTFLDDTYTPYQLRQQQMRHNLQHKILEDKNLETEITPPDNCSVYTSNFEWAKRNHPLSQMARKKRDTLMGHPLVLALIRHKWDSCKAFYYSFLLFYAFFVAIYTTYMLVAEPPYLIENDTFIEQCEEPDAEWEATKYQDVTKVILIIVAVIGVIIEVFQWIATGRLYFDYMNLMDWFTYVSVVLVVIDMTNCGYRKDWQWQVGAVGMLFAWFDLLLYLRRLPALGIYVVMITEIFFTFAKFFLIFFLFILAFAFTFHVLLQNQDAFDHRGESIVKTWVMMIGEFDFNDIFHAEEEEEEVQYKTTSYIVFVLFMVVMGIIILNLLVGLAVDDVGGLRYHSSVVKLQMQIDLALDIELALPSSWRRALSFCKWNQRYRPNIVKSRLQKMRELFTYVTNGNTLKETAIVRAVRSMDVDREDETRRLEVRFNQKLENINKWLGKVYDKMDSNEILIRKMVAKTRTDSYM